MTLRRGAVDPESASDDGGLVVLHLFARMTSAFRPHALEDALLRAAESGIRSVAFAVLGHKADVGILLAGEDTWALRDAQAAVGASGLELVSSYLSITEISEYATNLPDVAKRHRLRPVLPPDGATVVAFYPMSKRRSPDQNWFELDFDERSRLMHDHGAHGRTHAGKVVQLVTASTGLDDWEWAVTLFAADLPALKDVVYELRYDEVSARYSDFGSFVIGLLCPPGELGRLQP